MSLAQNTLDKAGDGTTLLSPAKPNVVRHIRKKALKPFEQDFIALVEGRRAGHMGQYEYSNGGMKIWDDFLKEHPEYYIPLEEQALIERCASASAELLKLSDIKKVTIVSRGPGTKFEAKEGVLIRAFQVAGIAIERVVYIDVSKTALNQSVKEGKELLPHLSDDDHIGIQADMFNPDTKNLYQVRGTEVGLAFGLTIANAECFPDSSIPMSSVEKNIQGIRGQQRKGSHLITAFDHNNDSRTAEAAYAGQEAFAKHMLEHHLGWKDMDDISFQAKYSDTSKIVSHGLHFSKEREYELSDGRVRYISGGTTLWFNSSVKLPKKITESAMEHSGYQYQTEQRVILAANDRLGYHHVVAS